MGTVTVRLSARPAHVRTARLVATSMARRSGVAEEFIDDVRLAVGEACARAVQLHQLRAPQEPITVELTDDTQFRVVVIDHATRDDRVLVPSQRKGEDGSENPGPETFALAMLQAVVNDLVIEREPQGTATRISMAWPISNTSTNDHTGADS